MSEAPPAEAPGSLRAELWRYLVVGGIAVAIDGGAYFGLTTGGLLNPIWAKRASFAAGAIWGFFANKYFTFGRPKFSIAEPLLFALVYVGGWFLNSLIHDMVLVHTGFKAAAFLLATAVSTCTNFAGQKWLVFRARGRNP